MTDFIFQIMFLFFISFMISTSTSFSIKVGDSVFALDFDNFFVGPLVLVEGNVLPVGL